MEHVLIYYINVVDTYDTRYHQGDSTFHHGFLCVQQYVQRHIHESVSDPLVLALPRLCFYLGMLKFNVHK